MCLQAVNDSVEGKVMKTTILMLCVSVVALFTDVCSCSVPLFLHLIITCNININKHEIIVTWYVIG